MERATLIAGGCEMAKLCYHESIDYLLEALPPVRAYYDRMAAPLYAVGNPGVLFGSILSAYLKDVGQGPVGGVHNAALKEAFRVIEAFSSSRDFDLECLVETCLLESLYDEPGLYVFVRYMGPETRRLARRLELRWGVPKWQRPL